MGNSCCCCCGRSKPPERSETSFSSSGRTSVPYRGNDTIYTPLINETSPSVNNFEVRNPRSTLTQLPSLPPPRIVSVEPTPRTVIKNTPPKVNTTIYTEPLPFTTYTFPKLDTSTFVPSKAASTVTPPKTVSSTATPSKAVSNYALLTAVSSTTVPSKTVSNYTPPKAVSNNTLPDVVSIHTTSKVVSTFTPFQPIYTFSPSTNASFFNSSSFILSDRDSRDTPTPPVVDNAIDIAYTDDRGKFLNLLFTLELTALRVDYFEKLITDHLKNGGMTTENSDELPLTYDSLPQYKKLYLPLMFYDGWAQIVGDFFEENEEENQLPPPIELRVYGTATTQSGNHLLIYLRGLLLKSELNNRKYNIANWIVLLQGESNKSDRALLENKKKTALGFVSVYERNINKKKNRRAYEHVNIFSFPEPLPLLEPDCDDDLLIEVEYIVEVFNSSEIRTLLSGRKNVTITPVSYLRPLLRQVETMSSMCYKNGFRMTFLSPNRNFFSPKFRQPANFKFCCSTDAFNEKQRNAVVACFNAVAEQNDQNRTVMIQGPPGTGKTHTLVAIVKCLLANIIDGSPPRILICTPSNGACDTIALRLLEANLKIIRIGNLSKVHPQVVSCHFENLVDKGLKFFEQKDQERKLLTEANVILSTLNSVQLGCMEMFRSVIAHDSEYQGKFTDTQRPPFRCVIIDEAGQCCEPELIMPLVYRTSKLILIGDHKQLPATVISNLAQGKGFGRSMFERFYLHFEREAESKKDSALNPVITLQWQYRMLEEICRFPSLHFYDGLLKTPPGTWQGAHIPLQPYLVFDVTNSKEAKTSESTKTSRYNVEEAIFVCRLIEAILANFGYPDIPEKVKELHKYNEELSKYKLNGLKKIDEVFEKFIQTIGVITFYRGMKDQLINRLKKLFGGELPSFIDVNTVDGFQGQERDIVILSCVRAFDRSHGSVGFVKSEQRMNVALTRAKSALYVAINADSFLRAPNWSELLADATKRDLVFRLTSKVGKKKLKRMISLN